MYYQNKIELLKDVFGANEVVVVEDKISIDGKDYPVINDVIVVSSPEKQTDFVKERLMSESENSGGKDFAEDIQYTFGSEWEEYSEILPEHEEEFKEYFDIVETDSLSESRVCDLGCGNGRWSYHLQGKCKEMVLVDFSDAIFVARKNLKNSDNCLFIMCDLREIPFRNDFADFLFCIGVLHHLPTNCLDEVKSLKRFAPSLLIYLYYALDNRPVFFRILLKIVTVVRGLLSRVRSRGFRKLFSWFGAYFIYLPLVLLGRFFSLFGIGKYIPLYEAYHDKSMGRIRQDVYDRFFTRIEQRVSKREIEHLEDSFGEVVVSEQKPYWHFLCKR